AKFNSFFILHNNLLWGEYWKGQLTTLAVLISPDMQDFESIHLATFGMTLEFDLPTINLFSLGV
ncbi:hypothetical protein HMI54_012634, partial [Coelomomyces lativittatus]